MYSSDLKDNKQMRDPMTKEEFAALPEADRMFIDGVRIKMAEQNTSSFALYKDMLKHNIPRELARSVLPVGTYSHMFATMNLNNLFRFLGERLHPHAQYEIRVYAQAMLELIEPIVPIAVNVFKEGL